MKITSSKPENKVQSSDQDNVSTPAGTQPNEAVFNQLLQLLSQIPVVSNEIKTATTDLDQNSSNKVDSNINNLLSNANNLLAQTAQVKTVDETSLLMEQLEQAGQKSNVGDTTSAADLLSMQMMKDSTQTKLTENASDAKTQTTENVSDANTQNKFSIGEDLKITASKAPNTPNTSKAPDIELIKSNEDGIAQNISLNKVQDNTLAKDILKQQSLDRLSQATIDISSRDNINVINNPAHTVKSIEQASSSDDRAHSAAQPMADSISLGLTSELNAAQVVSSTVPFEMPNKVKIDQNSKYMDAFINLGQFINSQTMQLSTDNHVQLAKAQVDSKSVFTDHFNPLNDLNVEVTSNSLDPRVGETYDAKIKIFPPELGHVIAKLKMEKNNAELVIVTENNQVKQIVESNLSVLKEHFQNSDIHLTQIDVQTSQAGDRGQENNQQNKQQSSIFEQSDELKQATLTPKVVSKPDNAIIDTYA